MKDKLVKTGHKKLYYRVRLVLRCFAFALGVAGLSAAPILISIATVQNKAATQQAVEAPTTVEDKTNGEVGFDLLYIPFVA
ncbi:MAG: hypothetical protein Q4F15_02145 [Bacillota bacterium]|nr:hypothetical protein [Bacillota bacterium]